MFMHYRVFSTTERYDGSTKRARSAAESFEKPGAECTKPVFAGHQHQQFAILLTAVFVKGAAPHLVTTQRAH